MKKRYLSAAVAAMIVLSTGVVMASPVELDGTASFRFRSDTNDSGDKNGSITKFVLNAKTNVAQNLDFYARFGAEGVSNSTWGSPKDFTDATGTKGFVGEIDQYGFLYHNAGFNYKIGRQSATIGATALLYNNNFKIGKSAFVDGINVTGKTGVTSINVIAAQEDNSGAVDNKLYAVHASYAPTKNWTVGATLAKYDATLDSNHYAVDAAYTAGKATYFGEYAKSDANTQNAAFDLGVAYAFDAKNSAYAIYNRVEQFADMGQHTDWENDGKGVYYGFDHKFNKATTGSLFLRTREQIVAPANDNTSFRATVTYKF